jgi:hypothetical protein
MVFTWEELGIGLGLVAQACNPSPREAKIRRITVRGQPGQIVHEILSQKYPTHTYTHTHTHTHTHTQAGVRAQVGKHQPSKHEALRSNPVLQYGNNNNSYIKRQGKDAISQLIGKDKAQGTEP